MGNDNSQKSKAPASSVPVRPVEVKAYVMACQTKMSLYRNKKVYEIKKKKDEAIAALKQNNLDIAKAKMESIIRLEDMITVYDILGPLCEIIKERITYICGFLIIFFCFIDGFCFNRQLIMIILFID